jgi:hypothetical protein
MVLNNDECEAGAILLGLVIHAVEATMPEILDDTALHVSQSFGKGARRT